MADGPLKIQLVVDKAGPDLYCGRTGDFPDMVAVAPTIEGVIARAPYAMTEYLQANKIFGPVDLTVLVIKSFQVMVNPPAPPRPPGQRPAGQAPGPRPPGAPGARPPGAPPAGGPRPPGAQAAGPRPPGAPGAKPGAPGAKPAAPAAPHRPKIKMLTVLPPGTLPVPPEAEEPTSPSAATTASTPTVAKP